MYKEKEMDEMDYQIIDYFQIFIITASIGWIWEVLMYIPYMGRFVNRGTLLGPYLPIYGFGSIAMVYFSRKNLENKGEILLQNICIATIIEYSSHYILEKLYGYYWWDYSGYLFNINNRISLEWMLIFGISGCLLVYKLAPKIKKYTEKIPIKKKKIYSIIYFCIFCLDFLFNINSPNIGIGIAWKAK